MVGSMSNRIGTVVEGGTLPKLTNVVVIGADEGHLLAAVRRGDTAAYGTLYEMHCESVRRLARRLCRDHHEADDVVSEVFCNTLRAIHRGGGPDAECRAYLLRSVRHTVSKVRTRKDTGRAVPTPIEGLESAGADEIGGPGGGREGGPATEALSGVSDRFRKVLWSVEVEGFDTNDVADAEQIAAPAAASLVYRARRALRRSFLRGAVRAPVAGADCVAIRALLPAHLDRESTAVTARRIDEHLAACSACATALDEMRTAHTRLASRSWLVLVPAIVRGVATDVIHVASAVGAPVAAAATIGAATLVFSAEPAVLPDEILAVAESTPPSERAPASSAVVTPTRTPRPAVVPATPRSPGPTARPAPSGQAGVAPGEVTETADATASPVAEPTPGPASDAARAVDPPPPGPVSTVPDELPGLPGVVHTPSILADVHAGVAPIIDDIVTPTLDVVDGIVSPTLGTVGDITTGVGGAVVGDNGLIDTLAGNIAVIDTTTDHLDQALGDVIGAVNQTVGRTLAGTHDLLGVLAPRGPASAPR